MSSGGKWDGRTKLAKLAGVPPSFFAYLKAQLEDESEADLQYNKIRTSRAKKHMYDNLAVCQVRMNSFVHQIRVLEEWELDLVRKVCGNSFGVGLTTPVPSLKQVKELSLPLNGTVWLKHNHEVRIVTCQPHQQDVDGGKCKRTFQNQQSYERPKKMRCSYRGLDFRHTQANNGVWELSVQARFVKVSGNASAVLKAQDAVLKRAVVSDAESEELEVQVGSHVRIGTPPILVTYEVESISASGIVRCIDPTDDEEPAVELTLREANELYNKYIRY
jgi:hypothetical protein